MRLKSMLETAMSATGSQYRRLTSPDLNTRMNVLRTSLQAADGVSVQLQAIRKSDRDRTAMKAARTKLAEECWAKFGYARAALAETSARVQSLKERLSWIDPPIKNEITREIRNSELRGVFRQLVDPDARASAFITAADTGHMEMLDAVLNSPDKLITSDIRTRGMEVYNGHARPDQVEALASAELLEADLKGVVQVIDMSLKALPEEKDEPVVMA